MPHPEHPTLRILDLPLLGEDVKEGNDPFYDIVHARTPLGYFGATRMSDRSWHWYLITVERAPDDFDSIGTDVYGDLAACIDNANRQLGALLHLRTTLTVRHVRGLLLDVIARLQGSAYMGSMERARSMREGITHLRRIARHLNIELPETQ